MTSPQIVAPTFQIVHAPAEEALRRFPTNYFHACLCDPPYEGVTAFGRHGGTRWEKEVSSGRDREKLWWEVWRVLRPGAFLLAASAPRTYHRIASHIESSGLEICDMVEWIYTSSMPNIVKIRGGRGSRLKPAHEPYVLACKPREGTFETNLKRWGVAGLSIEECRSAGHLPTNLLLRTSIKHGGAHFFHAKASAKERGEKNTHPTLKPLRLCEWLARLVRQPGRKGEHLRIVVPFSGAGSEVIGALWAGWQEVVGIEREKEYVRISRRRVPKWCPGVVGT